MAEITKPILLDESFNAKMDSLIEAVKYSGGAGKPKTFEDIQRMCRQGTIKQWLEVGEEFTFKYNGNDVPAVVMQFIENGRSGSLAIKNTNLKNGVVFQTKDLLMNLQFDEKEAFYYSPEGLPAGAYSFILREHSWFSGDVGKTFYFTLAHALPANGQIVFQQSYNATLEGASIKTYAKGDATVIDTATMSSTAISGATALGELKNSFSGNFNSCQRALLGNSRWSESAIRQMLNSNGNAGTYWQPQNHWDRRPSWYGSQAGFMKGLDTDLLPYVAEMSVDTYKNTVCDGGGLDTTIDKFFLAGNNEMYYPTEGADNGVVWELYVKSSQYASPNAGADPCRIKKLNGSATYWWLRSPHVGHARDARLVLPSGERDNHDADTSYGLAPAFVIA